MRCGLGSTQVVTACHRGFPRLFPRFPGQSKFLFFARCPFLFPLQFPGAESKGWGNRKRELSRESVTKPSRPRPSYNGTRLLFLFSFQRALHRQSAAPEIKIEAGNKGILFGKRGLAESTGVLRCPVCPVRDTTKCDSGFTILAILTGWVCEPVRMRPSCASHSIHRSRPGAKLAHDDPRAVSAMASPRGKWSSRRRGSHACACHPPNFSRFSPGFSRLPSGGAEDAGPWIWHSIQDLASRAGRRGKRVARWVDLPFSGSGLCRRRSLAQSCPGVAPLAWSAGLIQARAQQTHRGPVLGGLYFLGVVRIRASV
ncbi:hypothetical protein B0J18DRAFT_298400 [Chaetomium sp. MPI-SDFR-AT-0129]|nr:hypothetical protein B0J18DRAFT_298400 [Chaetomium sp. MPI-SDFR-AT-0129]